MKAEKQTTEKIKKNLNQIAAFRVEGNKYTVANKKQTKPLYAITRMLDRINIADPFKRYSERLNEVNKKIDDIKVKYQSVNEDGDLIYHDKECTLRKFTRDNELACRNEIQAENERWEKEMEGIFKKEVELEPFYITDQKFLKELTFGQIEAFRGFVIHEDFEPEFEEDKEDQKE